MTELVPKASYTSRDYKSFLDELKGFIAASRPDLLSDFYDSNTGVALLEVIGLAVDMLSVGQDITAQELFLATCQRPESGLRIARSMGYTPRAATPAEVLVRSSSLPDALITNGGTVPEGSVIKGTNGLVYELLEDYGVAAGDTVIRLTLREGSSYSEEYAPTSAKNQEIFSSNGVVADASWVVYVGDPTNPSNLWTQVDNVQFEGSATKTYDSYLDGLGRLHCRFGDGIAGKIPDDVATLFYRTTNGVSGNSPVSSIRGSIKVNLQSPGTGTVSVSFENKDTDLSINGGTIAHAAESSGLTIASATQSGSFANTPIQAGTAVLTTNLPGGAGTIVLQDNGAGVFVVVVNSTIFSVASSSVTYSTGAWTYTTTAALPAGGSITADYFSIQAGNAATSLVIGAASGGADRESLAELKRNIPAYIRSQDAIKSVADYNDVLRRLAGVALAFTDLWLSSYTSNAVKVHIWASEVIDFKSSDSAAITPTESVPYTRYAQVQQDKVNDVQAFLKPRTILTVHNVILRPQMLWVDLYLGAVVYDKRFSALDVRKAVTAAVIGVFQSSTGFAIRMSEVYNAIRDALGVKWFNIERATTGHQQTSAELQGSTVLASPTVSGTLLETYVVPKSVTITVEQTSSSKIVATDNGAGIFVVTSGAAVISSSSLNYLTGAWTITFTANLIPNQNVLASYSDVRTDYRRVQNVVFDGGGPLADPWPSPGVPTTSPITPPYKDGRPIKASRPSASLIPLISITRSFASGVVTAVATSVTPHGLTVGASVVVAGATPGIYDGTVDLTAVTSSTFTYQFNSASDPGAITGSALTARAVTVVAPFASGDLLQYDKLQDITVDATESLARFFDETYLYNNEIFYDSVESLSTDIRSINLRRLVFDLTPE